MHASGKLLTDCTKTQAGRLAGWQAGGVSYPQIVIIIYKKQLQKKKKKNLISEDEW